MKYCSTHLQTFVWPELLYTRLSYYHNVYTNAGLFCSRLLMQQSISQMNFASEGVGNGDVGQRSPLAL